MRCTRNAKDRKRLEVMADKTMADMWEYRRHKENNNTETKSSEEKEFTQHGGNTEREEMMRRGNTQLKKDTIAK